MIAFDLACDCGYHFEGWFQSHESLSNQIECGLLACPQCAGTGIRKLISPVAYHTSQDQTHDRTIESNARVNLDKAAVKFLHALQQYVEKNFEDVGTNLASEALKIHYGIEESRNIRGIATLAEEEMLKNEGVNIVKIPLPNKSNS